MDEYRIQVKRIERKIHGNKKRQGTLTEVSLKEIINNWLEEAQDEVGLKPHALLEVSVLSLASDTSSNLFEEFWQYSLS